MLLWNRPYISVVIRRQTFTRLQGIWNCKIAQDVYNVKRYAKYPKYRNPLLYLMDKIIIHRGSTFNDIPKKYEFA